MRKREVLAGLAGFALVLSGVRCSSVDHREDGRIEAIVRKEGSLSRLIVRNAAGQEISSVLFDPRTGVEDYATQRFFGFDANALMDMEDRGQPGQIPPECTAVARLWQGEFARLLKKEPQRGVLKRQSQLLALCLDLIGGEHSDGCSGVPDFDFRGCCVSHDICYAAGGSAEDRLRCDFELHDCIADAGHPILAMIYFGGVRAFGGSTFRRR